MTAQAADFGKRSTERSRRSLSRGETGESLFAEQPDLDRLLWVLRRARGFGLYFARCNVPAYRDRLMDALTARLEAPAARVDLGEAGPASLEARLAAVLEGTANGEAVFVYNLETFLPSGDDARRERTLQELNWRRGAFARLRRPLVFWLGEYALTALARGAPDFYDWYSGVYEFDVPPEERLGLLQSSLHALGQDHILGSLSLREHDRWAEVLENLLAEARGGTIAELQARSNLLGELGLLAHTRSRFRRAIAHYEQALAISRETGDRHGEGAHLANMGIAWKNSGKLEKARNFWLQALEIYEKIESPHVQTVRGWLAALESRPAGR